jgi:hypothetical protein
MDGRLPPKAMSWGLYHTHSMQSVSKRRGSIPGQGAYLALFAKYNHHTSTRDYRPDYHVDEEETNSSVQLCTSTVACATLHSEGIRPL